MSTAEDASAEPVDFLDLATSNDPRALSKMLRQQPVMRIRDQFTVITQREHIEAALRSPDLFSSGAEAVALGNIRPLIPLQIDPPKHVKYRRILDPLFAPRHVNGLENEVVDLVGSLLEDLVPLGGCDLHETFTVPLPCTVFLRLLGLPLEDLDECLSMKDGIIRPDARSEAAVRKATADRIYTYFQKFIEKRRRKPEDDLLSRIMASELDGTRLSDEEVTDICFLFMIAGLDTVTDSLDCFFAYLAQNPEEQDRFVNEPEIIPSAVEELLRWETPVPTIARVATTDTEVAGCPVRAGEVVMLLLGSANTDETAVEGADVVDLERNPNPHLAFGGGIHRCLGSHLARVELRVALREFHKRVPRYALAPDTVLEYTPGLRSLHHLPLVFSR